MTISIRVCFDVLFFQREYHRCHRRLGVRHCLLPVSRHRLMPRSCRFRVPDVSRRTGLEGVSLLRSHSLSRTSCSSSCRRCACHASLLFRRPTLALRRSRRRSAVAHLGSRSCVCSHSRSSSAVQDVALTDPPSASTPSACRWRTPTVVRRGGPLSSPLASASFCIQLYTESSRSGG